MLKRSGGDWGIGRACGTMGSARDGTVRTVETRDARVNDTDRRMIHKATNLHGYILF